MTKQLVLSVSELTKAIKRQLEGEFSPAWVCGEVSNFVHHSSGHMYLSLKDAQAQIRVVIFRNLNQGFKFQIENGLELIISGPVTVYERSGQYQIVAHYVEPKGQGALQLAFEQLKQKLNEEGLFDAAHKKPLPAYPQTIGVVTSPTGAAIRDILHVLNRRYPLAEVILCPVKVQGDGSAKEIARAIDCFNQSHPVDVLIVGRGGGSLEDLWAFNEEVVARSIFASHIPVISAVGHEIDVTIADFVADYRAPTPSAAAEIAVPDQADLEAVLTNSIKHLKSALGLNLNRARHALERLSSHYVFRDKLGLIRQFEQRVDEALSQAKTRLEWKFQMLRSDILRLKEQLRLLNPRLTLQANRQKLDFLERQLVRLWLRQVRFQQNQLMVYQDKLRVLNPLNVLSRGYSIVFDEKAESVIKSLDQIDLEQNVTVRLHGGEFLAVVKEKRVRG